MQTVYRLLVRAEPGLLERLCMSIREEEADKEDEDREWPGHKQRKDETSKVLVYNSYIYPTLGNKKQLFDWLDQRFRGCAEMSLDLELWLICCSISFNFN